MKQLLFSFFCLILFSNISAQEKPDTLSTQQQLFKELADNACDCIDTINNYNKAREEVVKEIHACINSQVSAYMMGVQLIEATKKIKSEAVKDSNININVNINETSREYEKVYFDLQTYIMKNCEVIKNKIAAEDKHSDKSMSKNTKALEQYYLGVDEAKAGLFQLAASYYEKAVAIDPEFAFAWDNLGVCYRKLGELDKALNAYNKSLELDPNGTMPLQNIAIVYRHKKEFKKAIKAYERLKAVKPNDPEVYYGLGQVYAGELGDLEKGLANLCVAYNLYIELKSPYRSDAEKMINLIYQEMKKQGKEKKFAEILAEHKISTGD